MAKRVSIINFKGGVGKTTLTFHLGTGLVRYHDARVLLIDMDHQSSLSVLCLQSERWGKKAQENLTVDAIFRPFIDDSATLPGKEIVVNSPLNDQYYASMDIVPASLQLDDTEIILTASHRGEPNKSEWDKRTHICRWIEETGVDADYDYIIFDCPPATKIVAQNAIAASHGYIIPVVPEAVMERGTPHLHKMVRSGIDARLKKLARDELATPRAIHVPKSELFGVVVTRIERSGNAYSGYTNDHTQHLRSLIGHWGNDLLKPYILKGAGVSETLTFSKPVYDRSMDSRIGGRGIDEQYKKLIGNIKRRIDND